MGFIDNYVVLCKKCKMKSSEIDVKSGRYIQEINILKIIGFIDRHIGHNHDLTIEMIAHEYDFLYEEEELYPEYIEDLDLTYQLNIVKFMEDFKEHNEMVDKVIEIRKKVLTEDDFGYSFQYPNLKGKLKVINEYISSNKEE